MYACCLYVYLKYFLKRSFITLINRNYKALNATENLTTLYFHSAGASGLVLILRSLQMTIFERRTVDFSG